MAKATRYCVRICIPENQYNSLVSQFVECLRYAGLCSEIHEGPNDSQWFDLYAPRGEPAGATHTWAKMNAERMRSFGYNAQECPVNTDFPILGSIFNDYLKQCGVR